MSSRTWTRAAAAEAILALVNDGDLRQRTSRTIRDLARSVFDMARYCDRLDALGSAASGRFAPLRADVDLLCGADDFDHDHYSGVGRTFETRRQSVRRMVARSAVLHEAPPTGCVIGFDAGIWADAHPQSTDRVPLAEFVRAGRPAGPWVTPVLRPGGNAVTSATAIAALLHVHLSDARRAADVRSRLNINRHPIDLLITADSAEVADVVRSVLGLPESQSLPIIPAIGHGPTPLDWFAAVLRDAAWSCYGIVGHLHDGGDAADHAAVDRHWGSAARWAGMRCSIVSLVLSRWIPRSASSVRRAVTSRISACFGRGQPWCKVHRAMEPAAAPCAPPARPKVCNTPAPTAPASPV